MGMDRPGTEPGPSRTLSGCDATTPTAPELRRPRVLNYLLGTAFSAEALSRPARSASAPLVGARCGQTSAAWKSAQAPAGHFSALKLCHGQARSACFLPICSFGWRSLWANECGLEKRSSTCRALFSAEALSRPARPAFSSFLLPAHSFGWCSLWANECGPARSASFLPCCCRRTPLVSFLFLSAAGALLWFVLAAAKRVRPPSALDAKLFLLVAPWGPIAFFQK